PLLSLFDNGNVRKTQNPNANSRGQVYWLDETNHTAVQVLNADLGTYSMAFGSAQLLRNGNFDFSSGLINPPVISGQSVEVLLNGAIDYILQSDGPAYRNLR